MKVLLDNQIFQIQKFGGISRYFSKLKQHINYIDQIDFYDPNLRPQLSYYERFMKKFSSKTSRNNDVNFQKSKIYSSKFENLEYDIFHPTYYDSYFLEHIKKPFVITVYDMIHEKYAGYFVVNNVSRNKRILCQAAAKIIAISQTTKNDLVEIFDIDPDKIEVIYLATDFESIEPVKPDMCIGENQYLLFTGNRSIYKNFFTFLIAVAPILQTDASLKLLCTGPEFTKAEQNWIIDLGLQTQVCSYFCENDNELAYLYRNAKCFIFPSLYEGFGFPVLEAFASDCPLVSSNGGSLPEIAGEGALYFDPKNIKEMRQQIELALYNEEIRKGLIKAGKNRLKDFSWEKCVEETESLYTKVM